MIGNTLEAKHKGKPVLILSVLDAPRDGRPRLLVLKTDSKLAVVPMDEIDVLWHYDQREGWIADSLSFGP